MEKAGSSKAGELLVGLVALPVLSVLAYSRVAFSWWSLLLSDGSLAGHFDLDNFLDHFIPSPQTASIVSSPDFTLCDPQLQS